MLKIQAKELESKLSNDENYQDFSFIKNQSKKLLMVKSKKLDNMTITRQNIKAYTNL